MGEGGLGREGEIKAMVFLWSWRIYTSENTPHKVIGNDNKLDTHSGIKKYLIKEERYQRLCAFVCVCVCVQHYEAISVMFCTTGATS